jgi:hypothetical protein
MERYTARGEIGSDSVRHLATDPRFLSFVHRFVFELYGGRVLRRDIGRSSFVSYAVGRRIKSNTDDEKQPTERERPICADEFSSPRQSLYPTYLMRLIESTQRRNSLLVRSADATKLTRLVQLRTLGGVKTRSQGEFPKIRGVGMQAGRAGIDPSFGIYS